MKNFDNIETNKSPFGNYRLGFGKSGTVYKITDEGAYWQAEIADNVPCNKGKPYRRFCEDTLADISKCLSND